MINHNNIEDYILSYIDGELDADEAIELESFIDSYPEYKALRDEYSDCKVDKIEHSFGNKKALLKKPKKRVVLWKPLSAAAAILLLLGSYFLLTKEDRQEPDSVSVMTDSSSASVAQTPPVITIDTIQQAAKPLPKVSSYTSPNSAGALVKTVKSKRASLLDVVSEPTTEAPYSNQSSPVVSVEKIKPLAIPGFSADVETLLVSEVSLGHPIVASSDKEYGNRLDVKKGVLGLKKILDAYSLVKSESSSGYEVTINFNNILNL